MDFILGVIACTLLITIIGTVKKFVVNRFIQMESDIDDLNELVSEIVSGSDESWHVQLKVFLHSLLKSSRKPLRFV